MKRGTRGFTLIELLVVIAIIAILAAILFPVFTQARAKARQISCLSNVKNLSLAILMYVDDYDGKFPLASTGFGNYYGCMWPDNVAKYIGAPEILHCPADGNMTPTMGPALSYFVEGETCLGTPVEDLVYFLPGTAGTNGGGIFTCQGRPEASIPEPGNTIMMGCSQIDTAVYALNDHYGVWDIRDIWDNRYRWITCNLASLCTADPGDKYTSGIYLHGGGSNFGFADGHAKWMKVEKCYYPTNLFAVIQPNPGGPDPFGSLVSYGYGGYLTTPW